MLARALGNARDVASVLQAEAISHIADVALGNWSACKVAAHLVALAGWAGWNWPSSALGLLIYGFENPAMFFMRGSSGFKWVFRAERYDEDNVHHAVGTLGGIMVGGTYALAEVEMRDLRQYGRTGEEGELRDLALDYAAYQVEGAVQVAWQFSDYQGSLSLARETWCDECDY